MRWALILSFVLVGLVGCESESGGDGEGGCNVSAPTSCPDDPPTYADVQPIFEERCIVCHTSDNDNTMCPMPGQCWSLEEYGHVRDWAPEIKTQVLECRMPLPTAGITMTNTEREEILTWLRCGAPE